MKHAIRQVKTLFISAGHSDTDPGAVGNGYAEADIVLEFRSLLAEALRDKITFGKDGEQGENLPLRDAWRMAAQYDVAVEFHCNAFSDPRATGVETLGGDAALGERLCRTISTVLGIPDRGPKGEASGQHSRLAFVSRGGGIIVELFFITNANDLVAYQKNKRRLANAVADVLLDEVAA